MSSYDDVLEKTKETLKELFELEEEQLTPEAKLYEDLDIDSIDAVDLIIELKKITGKQIEPEHFKDVSTLNDVVNAIAKL